MIDIPFDQYQRYKTTEIMVNSLKEYHKLNKIKIIEVGANEHKNLERFLVNDDIYYLDISIPKHLENDPKYILGDATNLMNIKDNEYDMVVALDVYEHIPEIKREKFLTELDRVSKYGVIICAPFNFKHVEDAEVRANEYYKSITGEDFIWLKEHIDEKLPSLEFTNKIIKNIIRRAFFNFEHGDIYLWEKLIKCHFYASRFDGLIEYRKLIDKLYNQDMFLCDVSKNNYRTFIMYSDDNLAVKFVESKIDELFSSEYKDKDIILLNELLSDLVCINNVNLINQKNQNKEIIYNLVYYIKEKQQIEYSESNKISKEIKQSKINSQLDLSMYNLDNEIRIDPISCNCIISIEDIYTIKENKRIDLKIKNTNCDIKFGNKYFFSTNDPQIYLDLNNICIDKLFFNYTLINHDDESINEIISILLNEYEKIKNLNKQLNDKSNFIKGLNVELDNNKTIIEELKSSLESKKQNIKELSTKSDILEQKINEIENSRSWRLIKNIKRVLKK